MLPRLAVEAHFNQLGHTYRHGKTFRLFDRAVIRPGLKFGLKALGLYTRGRRNALKLEVRRVTLRYANLPKAFDGFRLLHLSDFHIDGVEGLAEALAALLKPLHCDLCVFTGDYRFEDRGAAPDVLPRMRKVVEAVSAEHGILGILGNHDEAQIAFDMETLGVRMLVNESVEIKSGGESIWVAGVDDPFDYRCHDLALAMEDVPRDAFKILLAHAPEIYEDAAARGVNLYLAGHTHAGQIRIPGWGALKHNAHCPQEFAFGPWKHRAMDGYTTSGAGCSSVPVRFHCAPEVVLFELRRTVA